MRKHFSKEIIYIFYCLFAVQYSNAQNQPAFEQYHFNQFIINPAYAGSKGTLDAQAFIRRQWTEMEGAPRTESVSAHTALGDEKHGIGITLLHDEMAVTDKLKFDFNYAFRIYTGGGVLAFGVSAGASYTQLNYAQLDAYADGDPAFINAPETVWSPNAGAGIWYSNNFMFTGFSAPVLLEQENVSSDIIEDNVGEIDLAEATRHYYYTLGFLIPVKENFSLKPYTLAKYSYGSPVQVDASLSMIFYDFLWMGGSYRTDNSFTIMAEYFLTKNTTLQKREIGFGYAYNFRTGNTGTLFGPTHELFISFNLDKHTTVFKNPRFF